MSLENLISDVDDQIVKIRTKSLDVSFNELYDMYVSGELIITPEYQRLFRWDEGKQSRFIESLILEMPVPPIFVIEKEDGIYELIDGLQRISSYLNFRGINFVQDIEAESTTDGLILEGCDIVKDLNGYQFDSLPKSLQIKLKRSFVRMEVMKKESEPSLKYHMFKRLNTGGDLLSDQEIRNCTIRLLGSNVIDFLEDCSRYPCYAKVIKRIGDDKLKRKYDQELVLRFFAIKNNLKNYKYPVTEFLTNYLEQVTKREEELFDIKKEKSIFERTFALIDQLWGEDAFSLRTSGGGFRNDFVLYLYDGTIPIADYIDSLKAEHLDLLKKEYDSIKHGEDIQSYKTGNVSGLNGRIKLFTKGVQRAIGCGNIEKSV